MSITSTSQENTSLKLAGLTALNQAASVMMVQGRLLQKIRLASVPHLQKFLMNETNTVIQSSAIIVTFPLEMQAALVK